jgi:hypothetical protein
MYPGAKFLLVEPHPNPYTLHPKPCTLHPTGAKFLLVEPHSHQICACFTATLRGVTWQKVHGRGASDGAEMCQVTGSELLSDIRICNSGRA